jgi:hypothetical protein
MKRIFLLLLALTGAALALATGACGILTNDLFYEDWDDPVPWDIDAPPTGWDILDLVPGGNTGWVHSEEGDGHCATVTPDVPENDYRYELRMDSTSIDCSTAGFVTLGMDFAIEFLGNPGIYFEIWVSTDGWSSHDVAMSHGMEDGNVGCTGG